MTSQIPLQDGQFVGEVPTPRRLILRVAGRLGVGALGFGALSFLISALVFAQEPTQAIPTTLALGLSILFSGTLSVGLAAITTTYAVRRLNPLYVAAVERQRDNGRGSVPSPLVLDHAFALPRRVVSAAAIGLLLATGIDIVWLGLSGMTGPPRFAVGLILLASGLLCSALLSVLMKTMVYPWLRCFLPEEIDSASSTTIDGPLPLQAGFAVMAVGFIATATIVGQVEQWSLLLALSTVAALIVGAAGAAGAGAIATALDRRVEQDLAKIATRMRGLRDRTADADAGEQYIATDFGTRSARDLAEQVNYLALRYLQDAAEERRVTRNLQDVQRSKTLFLASMSHDLRSPLNSVLGFSEILVSGVDGELAEAQLESVRMIAKSGEQLLRLLNNVLDSARMELGRLTLRRAWTPSVEILTEAVRQARELIRDTELEIVADLQPGLPPVYVDSERIVQAVVELFSHAAIAMDSGSIRMWARVSPANRSRREVWVDVADTSLGIRAEDRDRIFQAFRDISSPSGRRVGGLGLGLSLARALVCAHGGDVWCQSREGEGTTFTVALPIQKSLLD